MQSGQAGPQVQNSSVSGSPKRKQPADPGYGKGWLTGSAAIASRLSSRGSAAGLRRGLRGARIPSDQLLRRGLWEVWAGCGRGQARSDANRDSACLSADRSWDAATLKMAPKSRSAKRREPRPSPGQSSTGKRRSSRNRARRSDRFFRVRLSRMPEGPNARRTIGCMGSEARTDYETRSRFILSPFIVFSHFRRDLTRCGIVLDSP
jgi:hypothetical protein